jgi:ubiquitin-protein ligase
MMTYALRSLSIHVPLRTVLSVIANLIEEPNAADPLNNEAAGLYQQDRAKFNKTAEEWVKKHAEKRPR